MSEGDIWYHLELIFGRWEQLEEEKEELQQQIGNIQKEQASLRSELESATCALKWLTPKKKGRTGIVPRSSKKVHVTEIAYSDELSAVIGDKVCILNPHTDQESLGLY